MRRLSAHWVGKGPWGERVLMPAEASHISPWRPRRRLPAMSDRSLDAPWSPPLDDARASATLPTSRAGGEHARAFWCIASVVRATEELEELDADVLSEIAQRLVEGLRDASVVDVCIEVGDLRVASPGFARTPWLLAREVPLPDRGTLRVTAAYRQEPPQGAAAAFSEVDAELLTLVATRLASIAARRSSRDRERVFSTVVAEAAESIAVLDGETLRLVEFNDAACAASGYSRAELGERGVADIVAPARLEAFLASVRDVRAGARATFETCLVRKDGTPRDVLLSLSSTGLHGRAHLVAVARDVTELRRAEAEARADQQFLEAVVDSLPGIFVVVDERACIRKSNREVQSLAARDEGALVGAPVMELIVDEDRALARDQLARAFAQGRASTEVVVKAADGRQIPYAFSAVRTVLGGERMVVATGWDVTSRRKARGELARYRKHLQELVAARTQQLEALNAKLRLNEERLEAMFELSHSADSISEKQLLQRALAEAVRLTSSACGELRLVDPRTLSQSCVALVPEGVGGGDAQTEPPPSSDRSRVWATALRTRRPVLLGGSSASLDDTSTSALAPFVAVPIVDGGVPQLILGVGDKESGYDEADVRQLELTGSALLRIIAKRRAEEALARAKEAADHASMAKSAFLANMSHEIRTPMNAIVGFAHLIRREALSKRQTEQLSKVSEAAHQLLQLINDILDFSKIEAGKLELEDHPFGIEAVFENVTNLVADKAAFKGIELVIDLDGVPPMVRGDELRIGQVLLNFASNAVKFTERGMICLRARVVAEVGDRRRVRLEVVDTGIGLREEQRARIFGAFEQADASTTRRFGGTGLGLAISKAIVEQMGGAIGVEGEFGAGSTFWCEIPVGIVDEPARARLSDNPIRRLRTLVADDLPEARQALAAELASLDVFVATASSGAEALLMIEEADAAGEPFEVVILDMRMPGLDGLAAAARLRELPLRGRPRYVLLTSFQEEVTADQAARADIDGVLPKPVVRSVLERVLLQLGDDGPASDARAPKVGEVERQLEAYRGARVLLAEDDPVNQEVATEMLRHVGLEVERAENGREAVARARKGKFDLILMDVQMPELDGLGAARLLRGFPETQHVPIVAMTANAFDEDRRRSLAAGMNDHVTKPVEPERLYAALLRWLPAPAGTPSPGPELAFAPAAPPAPVSPKTQRPWHRSSGRLPRISADAADLVHRLALVAGLDAGAGLARLRGDERAYGRVLRLFVDRHAGDAAAMCSRAAAGDHAAVTAIAHTLKGAAGNLGATKLAARAAELETAARSGGAAELTNKLDALELELAHLLTGLRLALPDEDAEPLGPVNWPRAAELSRQLESLLANDDSAAHELFSEARAELAPALGEALGVLGAKIDRFDFPAALLALRAAVEAEPRLR